MTKDDLIHFAEQKKRAMLTLYNVRSERHDLTRQDVRICAGIVAEVAAEKGEDGKPLYSNEEKRKAEAQRREDANKGLAEIREHAKRRDVEIAEIEADIAYLTDMIKIGVAFSMDEQMYRVLADNVELSGEKASPVFDGTLGPR